MIHIFKSNDGKWNYCPEVVRHWPGFQESGRFKTREDAERAVVADKACWGHATRIETGNWLIHGWDIIRPAPKGPRPKCLDQFLEIAHKPKHERS